MKQLSRLEIPESGTGLRKESSRFPERRGTGRGRSPLMEIGRDATVREHFPIAKDDEMRRERFLVVGDDGAGRGIRELGGRDMGGIPV